MKYKLKWGSHFVDHKQYFEGDVIPNVPDRHLEKWPNRFKEIEEETKKSKEVEEQNEEQPKEEPNEEVDYEEEVKQYHKGGGYYDIPGVDKTVKGKEKAIELLKEE